ncbi:MAG: bifunctional alpha/beta hydrolase/OsmC family protein [Gammaproteobacteria bacterium]|nr:bifunctional alpha/beta hydrolase/OsmC family protein [Gammaproteobacteria bacterium]
MARIKFKFPNDAGDQLAGLLETPDADQPIREYALFAHCFTCGKDIAAASRISRALSQRGIAVLRFDFTGLGNSDGDFANTNFSSNVQDLLSAAQELARSHRAPSLLIGHSLGGAAVLSAAQQIASVRAVVTIGAPATADHVQHLFSDSSQTLLEEGIAEVTLGFRKFTIKKQLLDDLQKHASPKHIQQLQAALLIFHSPVDDIVSIDEAARIYQSARHPKSFISLDDADHLLSKKEDAEYVAQALTAWASRYLSEESIVEDNRYGSAPKAAKGEVVVTERDKKFLRGLYSENHQLMADEPKSFGGQDLGPNPYDLLLMSLGACTSMTLRMYANHKGLPIEDILVRLKHEHVHAQDCADCEGREGKLEKITRRITFQGDLTESQKKRLIEIADRCPVHKTIKGNPVIVTKLAE